VFCRAVFLYYFVVVHHSVLLRQVIDLKIKFIFIGTEKGDFHTAEENDRFMHLIHRGVLMGLKSADLLSEEQHRTAENLLYQQYRNTLHPAEHD